MAVLYLICSLLLIDYIKCTSLPIPSRQVLFYPGQPAGIGLQPIIPQANGADRIDFQQRTPFTDRFYIYPNNIPIPSGAQTPNYNEIVPNVNVRPSLNPNAVFIPRPPGSQNGFQPDSVLISNVRPQPQNPLLFPQQNGQFFPGGAPLVPFNFNVFGNGGGSAAQPGSPAARPTPEDAELIPETVNNNQKPEKIQKDENREKEGDLSKLENPDKPNAAGEQDVLAAADKNSNIPDNRFPTQVPAVQPGQRFFVLNGQPLYMYSSQPFQFQPQFFAPGNPQEFDARQNSKDVETFNPNELSSNRELLQQHQLLLPNEFRQNYELLQPRLESKQNLQRVETQSKGTKNLNLKENKQNQKEQSQLEESTTPFRLNYESRQVFGAPILLRQLAIQNNKLRKFGPNAENIEPELLPESNKQSEPTDENTNVPAFEFARYLAQKQMDAKSSPQVEKVVEN